MRTIAIVNQKGGCGKTTTAINLAAVFARRGHRTLLVDLDPQSHCAAGLGVPESQIEYSIGDALLADHTHGFNPTSLVWEVARNLDLAPSTMRLAGLEAPGGGLHQLADKDRRLESLLTTLQNRYDVCILDCPPTIGLLTFNALRAAREALIPVETGFFSLRGAEKQWQTIQRTVDHLGRPMACHLLPTLHNATSKTAQDILAALHKQFAGQIVPVVLHEHEALREAATRGQSVVEFAPDSPAHHNIDELAQWLEEHAVRPSVQIDVYRSQPPQPYVPQHQNEMPASTTHCDGGGRAGELVRRVRDLTQRAETPHEPAQAQPSVHRDMSHLYGVRQTSQGVLFVQPGEPDVRVAVAGTFNNWSTTTHIMRFNYDVGVHEVIVDIPPGQHLYQIVVDGIWQPDAYNASQSYDASGRATSVLNVHQNLVPR